MKLNRQQIQERAMHVLENNPNGVRWTDLLGAVAATTSDTPHNSIHGGIHNLLITRTNEIHKIARGTYRLAKFVSADDALADFEQAASIANAAPVLGTSPQSLAEQDFYASFAEWLEENDEVTIATALGGASLGSKWGTPDVIGVLKPLAQDIFKFWPQIVSAEIKSVPGEPVVAFGQAVAYRLFSHKSYIVVPNTTAPEDIERLTALCSIHGIGLVTFTLDKILPKYNSIILPVNSTPDVYYINKMLDHLKKKQPLILNKLFS